MNEGGIEVFTGKFGGGKSYNAVRECIDHFCRGGYVAGNLALNWEAIKTYARDRRGVVLQDQQWIPLEESEIQDFFRKIPASASPDFPVLVVLDECGLFFSSDKWKEVSPEFKTFLPQPRKFGIRLVCIIQNFERLLKPVREMVAWRHAFRDMAKHELWGMQFKLQLPSWIARLFGCQRFELLPFFIHSRYDYKQPVGGQQKPIGGTKWIKKDPAIYACYNSYHLHGEHIDLQTVSRLQLERVPVKKDTAEICLSLCLCLLFLLLVFV